MGVVVVVGGFVVEVVGGGVDVVGIVVIEVVGGVLVVTTDVEVVGGLLVVTGVVVVTAVVVGVVAGGLEVVVDVFEQLSPPASMVATATVTRAILSGLNISELLMPNLIRQYMARNLK
jgi:hypothetical protein